MSTKKVAAEIYDLFIREPALLGINVMFCDRPNTSFGELLTSRHFQAKYFPRTFQ